MIKKNIKIIVHASAGWEDYPGMKKALSKLLEPVSGPLFEIEVVTADGPGASKLPQLWAAEMGYRVTTWYSSPTNSLVSLKMVQYCMTAQDAKLIIFTDRGPEDMHLIGLFKDLIGEAAIAMITI